MKSAIRTYLRSSQKTGYEYFVSVTLDRITGLYHVNAQDTYGTKHRVYFQHSTARDAAQHYAFSVDTWVATMEKRTK